MRPALLRRILLIQALETADPEGDVLPTPERKQATRDAVGSLTRDSGEREQAEFVGRRATLLCGHLAARFPAVESVISPPRRLRYLVPTILLLAIAIGWSTQALGEEKRVNILSFPLIGILGWNLLVYLVEGIRFAVARLSRSGSTVETPDGPLARLAETTESLPARFGRELPESEMPPLLRLGISNFQQRWRGLKESIAWLRIRGVLHLAAAVLATAAIGGMYAKGIATEYRAYWESTFLEASTVESLLHTLLGPASAISGISIPEIASLQWSADTTDPSASSGDAAPWIHLYAITMALFVIVPRLLLAALHSASARKREHRLDPRSLPGAGLYYERLVAEALGTALNVAALPYCHQLSPTAEAALERDLERDLDAPIDLQWLPAVSLPEEEESLLRFAEGIDQLPAHLVLCFDFAVTPEEETHGNWIRSVREALVDAGSETRPRVALDAESFDAIRRRLADFSERREERSRAWRTIAGPLREQLQVVPENPS